VFLNIPLLAYLIDKLFGEFSFIKHPIIVMGDYIKWFEKRFYANSLFRGLQLTLSLILLTYTFTHFTIVLISQIDYEPLEILILALIASTTIASHMLYSAVSDIIKNPQNIKYLVSRDTKELNSSNINKAAIETYAENLSDGVIAPLFYLLIFGLEGAFVYKAINTLDSMVGYRNERYEKFGKVSAVLDDLVNFIPARVTALLIAILMGSKKALLNFYAYGKKHDSPNAGHPISAMALAIGVKLGGDTTYFGKVKKKAWFGDEKEKIEAKDITNALSFQWRLDSFITLSLGVITYAKL
jgi:adenosylcobinamide-phosphate synthase